MCPEVSFKILLFKVLLAVAISLTSLAVAVQLHAPPPQLSLTPLRASPVASLVEWWPGRDGKRDLSRMFQGAWPTSRGSSCLFTKVRRVADARSSVSQPDEASGEPVLAID